MALDQHSPKYQVFLAAVKNGLIEEVEEQLSVHPEFLDLADGRESKPLHWAAQNGGDYMMKILKAVGAIVLSHERLSPHQIEMLQQPIPEEEEILEIRFRIYFSRSLLSQLL